MNFRGSINSSRLCKKLCGWAYKFVFFRDKIFFRFSEESQKRWRIYCSKKKTSRSVNLVQGR